MRTKLSMIHAALAMSQRFDADESAVLARQLESIEKVVTQTIYPELKALMFVPLIAGVDPGADIYTWQRSDMVGEAKLMANRGGDLPRVDMSLNENYVPIRTVGDKYDYTTQELRAFQLAKARGGSIQLDVERARIARLMIDRKIDAMVTSGESSVSGLTGFVNNSNVTIIAPTAGAWSTATAPQILQDMQKLEKQVYTQSNEALPATTMLLPLNQFAIASQTPLGVNSDKTVLQFFLANSLSIKEVLPWYKLTNAGAGGSIDRAVAYRRDPMVVGAVVPLLFEQQPPQPRDLGFDIACEARCGGCVVKMPLGMAYLDSI